MAEIQGIVDGESILRFDDTSPEFWRGMDVGRLMTQLDEEPEVHEGFFRRDVEEYLARVADHFEYEMLVEDVRMAEEYEPELEVAEGEGPSDEGEHEEPDGTRALLDELDELIFVTFVKRDAKEGTPDLQIVSADED